MAQIAKKKSVDFLIKINKNPLLVPIPGTERCQPASKGNRGLTECQGLAFREKNTNTK